MKQSRVLRSGSGVKLRLGLRALASWPRFGQVFFCSRMPAGPEDTYQGRCSIINGLKLVFVSYDQHRRMTSTDVMTGTDEEMLCGEP